LDDHQRQALAHRRAAHDVGPAARELGAGHHLGRHIGRAQAGGGFPEGQVGNARHRRDPHTPGHFDLADCETVAHFICIPTALFLGKLCGAVNPPSLDKFPGSG
jgi:hypothetical protein